MEMTTLGEVFGGSAAEAVLLHLYHYGESYGRAISSDFNITLFSVQRQLDKFEKAGVLVCKKQGKTLVFTWNAKSRFAMRMKELVAVVYEGMSLEERETLFPTRRRPRSKEKPITYSKP
jgi:hypothetical protein